MNLLLIHGAHYIKSHEKLMELINKAKEKKWDIERYEGNNLSYIKDIIQNQSLFKNKKLIIFKDCDFIDKNVLNYLSKYENNDIITILYFKDRVGDSLLKNRGIFKEIYEYEIEKHIFKFLDSFYPKNASNCLKLLNMTLENENLEFIFYLLSKHVKDLIWVKKEPSTIPYPSWRVSKLENQANKFTLFNLKEILKILSDIDISVKTSKANLKDSLDLLIITKLE